MIPAAALALALTAHQIAALNQACTEGSYYGLCKTFMAIVMVESSACIQRVGDDGNSLGCSQLMVQTARKTCRCKVSACVLEKNDKVNLRIGAQYLADCYARFYPDRNRATVCFNIGPYKAASLTPSEVAHSRYVARVNAWLAKLKQIPISHD